MKKLWLQFTNRFGRSILHPQYIVKKIEYSAILYAKKYAKGSLLDIGCGTMLYKEDLLEVVDKYTGLDYPVTKKLYEGAPEPDILGDAKDLPFADNSFDSILMLQVLEHIDEPEIALKEARRVLKKNGSLIISIPFLYPIHDAPHDYTRFTEYAIKKLLTANFKILKFSKDGSFLEFWMESLILFIFGRAKQLMDKDNIFFKILAASMLLIGFPLAVGANLISIILKPTNSWTSNFANTFPLNYTLVAKKIN